MQGLKFKAFYKPNKSIYDVLCLDFASNEIRLWDDYAEYDFTCTFEEVELLQFTGLHDKAGVEIYVGDFVKHGAWIYEIQYKGGFIMHCINGLNPDFVLSDDWANVAKDDFAVVGSKFHEK